MGKLSQQARMNEAAVADLNATLADHAERAFIRNYGWIIGSALAQNYRDYLCHGNDERYESVKDRILSCNIAGARRG